MILIPKSTAVMSLDVIIHLKLVACQLTLVLGRFIPKLLVTCSTFR